MFISFGLATHAWQLQCRDNNMCGMSLFRQMRIITFRLVFCFILPKFIYQAACCRTGYKTNPPGGIVAACQYITHRGRERERDDRVHIELWPWYKVAEMVICANRDVQ